jgi:hypothetical protein
MAFLSPSPAIPTPHRGLRYSMSANQISEIVAGWIVIISIIALFVYLYKKFILTHPKYKIILPGILKFLKTEWKTIIAITLAILFLQVLWAIVDQLEYISGLSSELSSIERSLNEIDRTIGLK